MKALARLWQVAGGLAFVLLLHDCTLPDTESGLVDLGGGLVLQRDGTVMAAWSLPGASAPEAYEPDVLDAPARLRWPASPPWLLAAPSLPRD